MIDILKDSLDSAKVLGRDHFRVALNLIMKVRLSAKFLS